jgi:uncharacterized membrane protein YecN with MAPEG domain
MSAWSQLTYNFGEMREPYTAFVTLLDMVLYVVLTFNVGRARGKFKVDAPATDGPPEFRRIYRVQMNTLEQLALHLPLLWLAALSIGDGFAAIFGLVWVIGRTLYARDYYREAKLRARGFLVALGMNAILLIGALIGVLASF